MNRVLCIVEPVVGGTIDGPSGKALTWARELAAAESAELHAAVVGALDDGALAALREQGVASVHSLQHELLAEYAPEAWGEAVAQLLVHGGPRVVVAPATDRGNEVLAHVAARTDLPLAVNCLELHSVDDGWELTRQRWGGVLVEEARLDTTTALVTVVPHGTTAVPAATAGAATVTRFTPELAEQLTVTRVRDRVTRSGGVSLATAPVVVAGGRGVGGAEGFTTLEELAELLGGAVGCSRVATNNGWRSHNDQVARRAHA